MRLQASLAFVLIAVTAVAVQAAPARPDSTPWAHWFAYRYDTRPKNVALLNDMPCSVLSHPDGWGGLYITNARAGAHGFFIDVPDCTAPAGSGWTIPIFYRSRRRLPDVQVTLGGLLATPFRVAPRPAATTTSRAFALNRRVAGVAAWQPPSPLAHWREHTLSRPDSRPRFERPLAAMPRFGAAPIMRPSSMRATLRRDPFAAATPATPQARSVAPPRACCVVMRSRAAGTAVPQHPAPKRRG